jgi:hypothetical protein
MVRGRIAIVLVSMMVAGAAGGMTLAGRWHFRAYYEPPVANASPLCGLSAVRAVCALRGVETSLSEVTRYAGVDSSGTKLEGCMKALSALGVPNTAVSFKSVMDLPEGRPHVCLMRTRSGYHAIAIVRRGEKCVTVDGSVIREVTSKEVDGLTAGMAVITH